MTVTPTVPILQDLILASANLVILGMVKTAQVKLDDNCMTSQFNKTIFISCETTWSCFAYAGTCIFDGHSLLVRSQQSSRQFISHMSNYGLNYFSDVNECADGTGICPLHAQCYNTKGSYYCMCSLGYIGDGQHNCSGLFNFFIK